MVDNNKITHKLSPEEKALGMSQNITRRDFIGGMAAGVGVGLLSKNAPLFASTASGPEYNVNFNGPPGKGDYRFSNGNTWEVLSAAHKIRDGNYEKQSLAAIDTGEELDLVIVGGGAAGLGGAYYFHKETGGHGSCLLIDNHPVFGGEAKRNEFDIDGVRLIAPQGSNLLFTPSEPNDGFLYEELTDIGMPLKYDYAEAKGTTNSLSFDRTNYSFLWLADVSDSVGFYNHKSTSNNKIVKNPWLKNLEGTHFSESDRAALMRWKFNSGLPPIPDGMNTDRWLDSMSIEEYFTKYLKLPPVTARYCDTVLGSAIGLGSATCSAFIGKDIHLPGFGDHSGEHKVPEPAIDQLLEIFRNVNVNCFPGGNAYVSRYFVKYLLPRAISGTGQPGEMIRGNIDFNELDKSGSFFRMRLNSTVVRVEHLKVSEGKGVRVTYMKDGKLFSVKTKSVLMASGGWVNRRVIPDLPKAHLDAYQSFIYAPVLVANVALTNWRFLDRLGISACRWFDGKFGFSCNIRNPIQVDGYSPPLDPDKPIVMTFYVPIVYPGLSARQQGAQGRWTVFGTSFREYESQIREQMVAMFSAGGFDPGRDIGGIILNRWGHAYIVPEPGFFFGLDGAPPARDVVRQPFDRIAFAHSELKGLQNYRGAVYESKRAIGQIRQYFI